MKRLLTLTLFLGFAWGQNAPLSNNIEYYDNGNIEFYILEHEEIVNGQLLPSGTGIHLTDTGVLDWCFLEDDTKIQGHLCRGNGHGFMTSFHPNGKLKTVWLAEDEIIQGIPCSKFRFLSAVFAGIHGKTGQTSFYENGQLKYCELSRDFIVNNKTYKKGNALKFSANGELQ
jgi:hypothetical protein